jgi:protoporphyrinogen/coproporphyrinogen III oxidase
MKSAVIGGGITGLCRALARQTQDVRCVLFEPGRLGGVIQTVYQDGFVLETGPNVLVEKPALSRLVDHLGLRDRIRYPAVDPYEQYVWFDGQMRPVPKSPVKLFSSSLLSPVGKYKLLRGALRRGRVESDDQSVESLFTSQIGEEATSRILDPVLQGIFGGDISKLSARAIFPEIWKHFAQHESLLSYFRHRRVAGRPKIFHIEGGFELLVNALANALTTPIVKRKISKVVPTEGGFHLISDGDSLGSFSDLSIATSGPATALFIRSLDADLADSLEKIVYAPLVVVHGSVCKSSFLPHRGFGVLFPRTEQSKVLGIMFHSQLFPAVSPDRYSLLTLCLGGRGKEDILDTDDETVMDIARRTVQDRLGIKDFSVLRITRWPRAIPQFDVGHWKLVEKMREVERKFPGLHFIGVDGGGVGVPDRVSVGLTIEE